MARKHYKKKFRPKRKRNYRKKKRVTQRRLPMGLPDRLRTRLNYQIGRSVVGGDLPADSFKSVEIKLNSPYDPVAALGGSQPPLYDNYAALYDKFIVNKCTIYAHIQNFSELPVQVLAMSEFDPTTNTPAFPNNPSTYNVWALGPTNRSRIKTLNTRLGGSGCQTIIKKTFYPNKIVGRNYFTSVNFSGEAAADPAKLVIGSLTFLPQSTGTEAWGCWYQLQVIYDVTFYDRKTIEVAAID